MAESVNNLSEEELRLFEELRKDSLNYWKLSNKRRFRGIWYSVINKYPESAHFIYELLQNADDALASQCSFILYKDHLIFKHNGSKHFNVSEAYENDLDKKVGDINSIVSIGDSPKDGTNAIGKFGIGFKSVFQYTDAPEIYDEKFKFRIENLIVPSLLNEDHPLRKQGETLFLLNFKNPESDNRNILYRLANLDSPILFLPNLQKVTWINKTEGVDTPHSYSKTIQSIRKEEDTKFELVTESNGNFSRKILLFTKSIDIPNKLQKQNICVGYYLTNDGESIDVNVRPKIFCFFKTDDSFDRCFICHAPFELVDSRSQRMSDSEVNKSLSKKIAKLAADALLWIRDYGIKTGKLFLKPILDIVPYSLYEKKHQNSYPWEHKPNFEDTEEGLFYNAYTKILKTNRIIPTRNGNYIYANDALICPKDIKDVLSKEQISKLLKNSVSDFIEIEYSKDILKQYLMKELSIKDFDQSAFAQYVTSEFMNTQTREWVISFYKYLREHARKLYTNDSTTQMSERLFWYVPIVKDSEGNWLTPYNRETFEPNVFLPIMKDSSLIGDNYKFIDDFYASNETAKKFFGEMGLHAPNVIDFLKNDVLPKYHNDKISIKNKILLDEFDKLYDIFEAYKDKNEEEITMLLFNEYYLCCKDNSPEGIHLYKMDNVYDDNDELRGFYEGFDNIPFFDYEFYEKSPKHRNKNEIRKWINKIGVSEGLHIDKICQTFNDEWLHFYLKKKVNWQINTRYFHKGDTRPNNLFELSSYQFDVIKDCNSTSVKDIKPKELLDYNIPFVEQIKWTKVNSLFLWKCLEFWNTNDINKLALIYRPFNDQTDLTYTTDSSLIHNLKELKWICRNDCSFCSPSEILAEDFHHLGYQENEKLEELLDFGVVAKQKYEQEENQREVQEAAIKDELFQVLNNEFGGDMNALKECTNKYHYSATNFSIIGTGSAEHDDDFFYEKSNVRKTIQYIGVKLYGQFLSDFLHVTFLNSEDGDSFDFNINGKFVVISTVANQNNDAIYLTSDQYTYMTDNHLANYHVVRISLKDLGIRIDRIRDAYGRDADINQNEHLKSECDKLVYDYWSSADVNTFKRLCQEYSISIHKEEYK